MVGSELEDESAAPRKARASEGELIELPPAAGAAPLFKEVLKRLLADVAVNRRFKRLVRRPVWRVGA